MTRKEPGGQQVATFGEDDEWEEKEDGEKCPICGDDHSLVDDASSGDGKDDE